MSSNANPDGTPAAREPGVTVSPGWNGTASQPVVPASRPQSTGAHGYPFGRWLTKRARFQAPGCTHESSATSTGRPTSSGVHDVGLRRNALRAPPLSHDTPFGCHGASCPRHARSGSWTGSAGTPQNVSVVPAIASPCGTSRTRTDSP